MMPNFYKEFEDRYRGTRELIKSRLRIYLPFVLPLKLFYEDCKALDLGCGRGEWLELLKEANIEARGIDIDDGMLAECRELGLAAEIGDAVSYIKALPDESQAIITAFHVIEHLPFEDLQLIVQEALRVLKPAGLLILETPNPENLMVGTASFYLDPTHLHPVPHQLLSFVAEYSGYYRTKVLRLQEPPGITTKENPSLLDIFIGVSRDYSIVAQKESAQEMLAAFDHLFEKEYGLTLEMLVARYESYTHAKTQDLLAEINSVRSQLTSVRSELHSVRSELDSAHSQLNSVYSRLDDVQDTLDKWRAPVQFVKKFLDPVRRLASHGTTMIKKVFKSN